MNGLIVNQQSTLLIIKIDNTRIKVDIEVIYCKYKDTIIHYINNLARHYSNYVRVMRGM